MKVRGFRLGQGLRQLQPWTCHLSDSQLFLWSIYFYLRQDTITVQSLVSLEHRNDLHQKGQSTIYFHIFFKILFIFRERGREAERKGEKHQ